MFTHDKALEVAESIAKRGFFPNEPLLVVEEESRLVVIEGNRRLAALKALREPALIEGTARRRIEQLSRSIVDQTAIATVPVIIAPSRKATDRLVAGRHVGTPVLAWEAENRASFILDKLAEGYDNDELRDELGFSLADIQKARQTRAIAEMARSLPLPEEVRAKLDNPRAKIFSTLERVVESTIGRAFLGVEPDSDHGLKGKIPKAEFIRGFSKLVTDVALGKQSSRSLNKNEDIEQYFGAWPEEDRPKRKVGSFLPADIIIGKSVASPLKVKKDPKKERSSPQFKTVLPKSLKVRNAPLRVQDIRNELTRLQRQKFPNAGAVLLRAFFELTVVEFLRRRGEIEKLIAKLGASGKLPYGAPTMKQMVPSLIAIAKKELTAAEANRVEKAIKYNDAAPFSVSDLHAFVHQSADLPSERDILQFWLRTEPLFRLMLEKEG